jgi:hypothetical protein
MRPLLTSRRRALFPEVLVEEIRGGVLGGEPQDERRAMGVARRYPSADGFLRGFWMGRVFLSAQASPKMKSRGGAHKTRTSSLPCSRIECCKRTGKVYTVLIAVSGIITLTGTTIETKYGSRRDLTLKAPARDAKTPAGHGG